MSIFEQNLQQGESICFESSLAYQKAPVSLNKGFNYHYISATILAICIWTLLVTRGLETPELSPRGGPACKQSSGIRALVSELSGCGSHIHPMWGS